MTLVPAYGREYKTAKAVKEDWANGKDFLVADMFSPYDGKPANRESFPSGTKVQIRFDKVRKVTVVQA